jgi:hypothetical protein
MGKTGNEGRQWVQRGRRWCVGVGEVMGGSGCGGFGVFGRRRDGEMGGNGKNTVRRYSE